MCKIMQLKPGVIPDQEHFYNAVWNNPHGYGIITRKDNKILDVVRECPKEGTDPKVVWDYITKHKDVERFVHVRWQTAGGISLENTQPFQVFKTKQRQIWFMHNGTFHMYKNYNSPNFGMHQHYSDLNNETDVDSDTKRFTEEELIPFFQSIKGTWDDRYVIKLLQKIWPSGSSKGILIANDLEPFFFQFNDWKTIPVDPKKPDGVKFLASNNEYFDKLQRGFEYERIKKEEERKRQEELSKRPVVVQNRVQDNSPYVLDSTHFNLKYGLSKKLKEVLTDWDMYTEEGYIALSNLELSEIETMLKKLVERNAVDDIAYMFMILTQLLADCGTQNLKLKTKLDGATKKIASLVQEASRQEENKVG